MHATIVTAFPEFFEDFLSTSIVGRAVKAGAIRVDLVNLRDFGRGGYRQIDDYSFGSGGMVLAAPPLFDALQRARGLRERDGESFVVYPSPQGRLLTQEIVETLVGQEHVVIVCGHYEGVDERFVEREVQLEVTIGDCVLTGGEIPAMAIVDAMSRLVPGVVGKSEAVSEDSFYGSMLDHPHYTRPSSWKGMEVPEVLLSGDAEAIRRWRRAKAVERTLERRSDLLCRAAIGDYLGGRVYLGVLSAEALPTPENVRDLALLCGIYGAQKPIFIVPDREARQNFSRETLDCVSVRLVGSLERAVDWVTGRERGEKPLTLVVGAPSLPKGRHWLELKRLSLECGRPLFFLLLEGQNAGLSPCSDLFFPLDSFEEKSMPLIGKATVLLDRFLGAK